MMDDSQAGTNALIFQDLIAPGSRRRLFMGVKSGRLPAAICEVNFAYPCGCTRAGFEFPRSDVLQGLPRCCLEAFH